MNTSMQYFLVVVEELSISRAAERLYVSQQCVSSHIKKLEQQYRVELFTRKPVFSLTEEGKALERSLLRQKVLESSLAEEMNAIRGQRTNRVRAGIHNTRVWGDRIFEKCGIGRDEGGDGGKTLEIRGKRRLPARDRGANYQQS